MSKNWRARAGAVVVMAMTIPLAFQSVALAARAQDSPAPATKPAPAKTPLKASASATSNHEAKLSSMQDAFALELYRRIADSNPRDNVFFSPYSVFIALAMTAEGARGETANEMGRALHLEPQLRRPDSTAGRPWNLEPVHQALAEESQRLLHGASKPSASGYELRLANALWAGADHPFAPEFLQTLAKHYGTGGARVVDFAHQSEASRQQINEWIAEQTQRRILDLLPPGSVDALTRLVITNAIWFKGSWSEPFEERITQPASFRSMDGASVQTPMMQRTIAGARYAAFRQDGSEFPTPDKVPYDTRDEPDNPKLYPGPGGFQVAELPYRGGELAMMIVLPHSADGLANLEGALEGGKLATWASRLASRKVAVLLPKFRLEQRLDLVAALRSMGMKRAFVDPGSGQGAQFGGMTHGSNPGDALYVGAVVHKAFVDVNEQGTEAAAATGVEMKATMVMLQPVKDFVPTFRADRPFLFLIRDVHTGAILFMGRLAMPSAPESH